MKAISLYIRVFYIHYQIFNYYETKIHTAIRAYLHA